MRVVPWADRGCVLSSGTRVERRWKTFSKRPVWLDQTPKPSVEMLMFWTSRGV